MILNAATIAEITHRQRPSAQARVLAALGIECKQRPDGSLVVLEDHVRKVLGDGLSLKHARRSTPCFDHVR